jgi:hypothetical protein
MKMIITTCGSFRTGTEIADAVTAYGLALARSRELDVIDIPFVDDDGSFHRLQMRIGWGIDTLVTTDGQSAEDLFEADTILDLLEKTRRLTARNGTFELPRLSAMPDDVDWDDVI